MGGQAEIRRRLIEEVFPDGVPGLWCPPLTHYRDDRTIDFERMSAHLGYTSRWVRGYLVPGTTGDGWEMDDGETMDVVRFAIAEARKDKLVLLLGVLRSETGAMQKVMDEMIELARVGSGLKDRMAALKEVHVAGFAVCPPKGAALTQADIEKGLSSTLNRGAPIALYQLPQVTENEVAPETFGRLVENHGNLILLKDTSGRDAIALSPVDKGGLFLTRGAEGDYVRWLKGGGGPYDGFLLSTANSFPNHLRYIMDEVEHHNLGAATETSERLTEAFQTVFDLVRPLPFGNAFTNANKAIDHYSAFGPSAGKMKGPMLHAGVRISAGIISATGDVLTRLSLMPKKGYLE